MYLLHLGVRDWLGSRLTDRVSAASVKAGAMGASGEAAPAAAVTAKLVGCIR
jgi:hypothetical protein